MSITASIICFVFLPTVIARTRTIHSAARTKSPSEAESHNTPYSPKSHATTAGVPLHILDSERLDRGAMLRAMLTHGTPPP